MSDFDETIMNELLSNPKVRKNVLKMTANELQFFKEALVKTGVYAKYCKERKPKGGK
jgi:hypothetical protein